MGTQMWHADVARVSLSPLTPGSSGASAEFLPKLPRIQTPWLFVNRFTRYEQGKASVVLEPSADVAQWIAALEGKAKDGLGDLADHFAPSLTENGWRINLPAACAVFGEPKAAGECQAALILEFVGVWVWNQRAGVKTKATQIKFVGKADIEHPRGTDRANGRSLDTSREDQEARA